MTYLRKFCKKNALEFCLSHNDFTVYKDIEIGTYVYYLETTKVVRSLSRLKIKNINQTSIQLSINMPHFLAKDAPQVELKPLLAKLKYTYLGLDSTYLVFINIDLNIE